MRNEISAEGQPAPAASNLDRRPISVRHHVGQRQTMREAVVSALVTISVLSAPLLSAVGCVGLAQPEATALHQIAAVLVTGALVLVLLALVVAHLTSSLIRQPSRARSAQRTAAIGRAVVL